MQAKEKRAFKLALHPLRLQASLLLLVCACVRALSSELLPLFSAIVVLLQLQQQQAEHFQPASQCGRWVLA